MAGMKRKNLVTATRMVRSSKVKGAGSEALELAELEARTEILWPATKHRAKPEGGKAGGGEQVARKRAKKGEGLPEGQAVSAAAPALLETEVFARKETEVFSQQETEIVTQQETEVVGAEAVEPPVKGAKGSRKGKAQNVKAVELVRTEPPEDFDAIWDLAWELRKERDAPVDWAGSESLGTDRQTGNVDKYHSMIALMLSSQTKDQVVAEAVKAMQAHPMGLTPQSVVEMSDQELDNYIFKVSPIFLSSITRSFLIV